MFVFGWLIYLFCWLIAAVCGQFTVGGVWVVRWCGFCCLGCVALLVLLVVVGSAMCLIDFISDAWWTILMLSWLVSIVGVVV